ncbi:MAG: YbaK/EbsC family protein [Clostridiales bacterium]|nr:YbaK/EbsC family protein [Clostridiales bacterium]
MSIDKVRAYFLTREVAPQIVEFEKPTQTVALAAEALGVAPARIAKSLSFWVGGKPILVVAAGDARVDNRKFRDTFACKATMLSAPEVEQHIGHAVGGVCPFAILPEVAVWLDQSLTRFDSVYPACGSGNSCVRLTLAELESLAENVAGWVDVCRLKE